MRNFLTRTSFSNSLNHHELWYPGFVDNFLSLLDKQSELQILKHDQEKNEIFNSAKCTACSSSPHLINCHLDARAQFRKGTQVERMFISAHALVHPTFSTGHALRRDKKINPNCKWCDGEINNERKYHKDYCPHILSILFGASYKFAKSSRLVRLPFLERNSAFGLGFYSYLNTKF